MKKIVEFTKIVKEIYKNYYNDDYKTFLERLEKTRAPMPWTKPAKICSKFIIINQK